MVRGGRAPRRRSSSRQPYGGGTHTTNVSSRTAGTKASHYTTVSSGDSKPTVTAYHGTPIAPTRSLSKAPARAQQTRTALQRVQRAYSSGPRYGKTFTPDEAASLIKSVGGTTREARDLSTKIVGESGGRPKAIGHDPGGTTGLGLWQMTTGVGNDELINKYGGPQAMLKPKPNAKAALELYRGGGLANWYAPSNPPGEPGKATPKVKPAKKDLKTLQKAGVSPKAETKSAKTKTKRSPASVAELFYDPGISIKDGQQTSPIGGHSDHVHVASNDPRAEKKFINIARNRFGLHVGENEFVGDPPEAGVHTEGSYHYREGILPSGRKINLGADISGDPSKMAAFDEFIAKKFGGNPQAGSGGQVVGGGGFSSGDISAYAKATGMSVNGAKAVAKKNPELIRRKLAKVRAAYGDTSYTDSSSSTSSGLTAISRRHGKPVV